MKPAPLISLRLNQISTHSWRLPDMVPEKGGDPLFVENVPKVLTRDKYTCCGCRFHSPPDAKGRSFMGIHHRNGNHKDHRIENLATICPLCHQVFHLGHVGLRNGGSIIWMPELSQAQINQICRAIFVTIAFEEREADRHDALNKALAKEGKPINDETPYEMYGSAQALYASMEMRAFYVEEVLAPGATDPAFFAQAVVELASNKKTISKELLDGLRLLPSMGRFTHAIQHWLALQDKALPVNEWKSLVEPEKVIA